MRIVHAAREHEIREHAKRHPGDNLTNDTLTLLDEARAQLKEAREDAVAMAKARHLLCHAPWCATACKAPCNCNYEEASKILAKTEKRVAWGVR
jgi:coproporphyrinogen III oxidase-like Fe-S oxidoreductase